MAERTLYVEQGHDTLSKIGATYFFTWWFLAPEVMPRKARRQGHLEWFCCSGRSEFYLVIAVITNLGIYYEITVTVSHGPLKGGELVKKDDVSVNVNGVKIPDVKSVEYSPLVGGFIVHHKSGQVTILPLKK